MVCKCVTIYLLKFGGDKVGRKIIGLTGAFGCGSSFIATNFFEKDGYLHCSLSSILKKMYKEQTGTDATERSQLQEFGNELRKNEPDILAKKIDEEIISKNSEQNIVIESIRNPAEISFFRDKYPEFILIGIFAEYDVRWNRVKNTYNNSKDAFDSDEKRDQGKSQPRYGQRISDCFFESDLILSNNEHINAVKHNDKYGEMKSKIDAYLNSLDEPISSNPTLVETLMAAAYTSGRRSKCIKRKVGAVITDKYDRIISSGFNGVPRSLKECISNTGECYRDIERERLASEISNELSFSDTELAKNTIKQKVKLLEKCRALHGEENAIMSLVGRGVDLTDSTIYVTTYPCNLCANKIVQAGISKVIYFEPYPVEEAKQIFKDANVETESFEGVTFRAFFKFFKYEP